MPEPMQKLSSSFQRAISKSIYGYSWLRSAMYFAEGLPIVLVQKAFRAHDAELPKLRRQQFMQLDHYMRRLFRDDASFFENGVYPKALLVPEKPFQHLKRYKSILTDSIGVGFRRNSKKHTQLPKDKGVSQSDYPDYYLRNFHFQTDGYLSKKSARLYGHQVEILFKGTASAMRRLVLRRLDKLKIQPRTILDLACGEGSSTRILASKFTKSRITALDLSPHYLSHAREQLADFTNIDFVQGRAEELVFKERSFDLVSSTFLFHEIPYEVRKQILQEAYRVLKPGGVFAILDSIQIGDNQELDWAITQFPVDFHEPFFTNYIKHPMEDLLRECGFEIQEREIGFFTKALFVTKRDI